MPRNLLLISSSKVYGCGFLENVADTLRSYLKEFSVKKVLFVPYANTDFDSSVTTVRTAFSELDIGSEVVGIHEGEDPVSQVLAAQAIFIGGGNTFLLLKTLYDLNLLEPIRRKVIEDGIPYIGSSAGTNVATVSINTTNDMPIVLPSSFKALGLVPFNINPHYLDSAPNTKHMGETRSERILQYLEMPDSHPVLGLREGSSLMIRDSKMTLVGNNPVVLFKRPNEIQEFPADSDLSFLLE